MEDRHQQRSARCLVRRGDAKANRRGLDGERRGQGSVALVGQEAAAPLALQLIAMLDPADDAWPRVDERPVNLASAHRRMTTAW